MNVSPRAWALGLLASIGLWSAGWGEAVAGDDRDAGVVAARAAEIDRLVLAKLEPLGVKPARCTDEVFVRRIYLDVTGTLPSAAEARAFLEDPDHEGKRARLIERLLASPAFDRYWSMKWGDLLRIKAEFPVNLWPNAAQAYHRWVMESLASNKRYDRFARELLTSSGSNFRVGPVNFYRAIQEKTPEGIATTVALTLMGTRAEKWPPQRFKDLQVFFSQVGYKPTREWKEEIVFWDPWGSAAWDRYHGELAALAKPEPPPPTLPKPAVPPAAKPTNKPTAKSAATAPKPDTAVNQVKVPAPVPAKPAAGSTNPPAQPGPKPAPKLEPTAPKVQSPPSNAPSPAKPAAPANSAASSATSESPAKETAKEPAKEPAQPPAKPAAQQPAKPAAQPPAKPAAQPPAKPAAQPTAKPAAQPAPKPNAAAAKPPVAKPAPPPPPPPPPSYLTTPLPPRPAVPPVRPVAKAPGEGVLPDGTRVKLPPDRDPREVFADWLIRPQNPWFTRNIANRVWAWLLGRGVIHEADDIRDDNPPSNPALLAFLEKETVASGYDLRHLYRIILNSGTYQSAATEQAAPSAAEANFASYPLRRLEAEVLIDAINRVTGAGDLYTSPIPEPFTYIPDDMPATAIADGSITSPFLALFGRSARASGMENERSNELRASQWLHLLNSSHIQRKLEQGPALKEIIGSNRKASEIADELYLTILSRFPTDEEIKAIDAYGKVGQWKRREDWIDIAWALMNSTEFLFRH